MNASDLTGPAQASEEFRATCGGHIYRVTIQQRRGRRADVEIGVGGRVAKLSPGPLYDQLIRPSAKSVAWGCHAEGAALFVVALSSGTPRHLAVLRTYFDAPPVPREISVQSRPVEDAETLLER